MWRDLLSESSGEDEDYTWDFEGDGFLPTAPQTLLMFLLAKRFARLAPRECCLGVLIDTFPSINFLFAKMKTSAESVPLTPCYPLSRFFLAVFPRM